MITDPKVNNPDDWEDVPSRFEIGVWFGGNDIESEGNWVWQDQSPMPTSSVTEVVFIHNGFATYIQLACVLRF